MVYKWDGKEADCYRLYVEEKKSLDEVMEYWREREFTPSKRAFQTQFKRWDFPLKHRRAHSEPELIARIKELWENNTMQKDMMKILADEGYDLNERELMRIRARNNWLLRAPNVNRPTDNRRQSDDHHTLMDGPEEAARNDDAQIQSGEMSQDSNVLPDTSLDVVQKRQERFAKLQAESDERWRTKKRRRRIRGYAGLPADPAGPPRFPSETTLDEAKAYLSLDNDLYRQVRDEFQAICEEEDVIRKTAAGPEKWAALKQRLVRDNSHLNNIFWGSNLQSQGKPSDLRDVSLDVICTDVTKRMRVLDRKMTLAEAKNIIGVNPEEARDIRQGFYDLLKAQHFTNKLAEGGEVWDAIKAKWIEQTELVRNVLAQGPDDPEYQKKLRAIEIICRDVMKRWRDEQVKLDPSRRKGPSSGPGPGPAKPRTSKDGQFPSRLRRSDADTPHISSGVSSAAGSSSLSSANPSSGHDFQIDPSLLLAAASDPSILQGLPPGPNPTPFPPVSGPTLNAFHNPQSNPTNTTGSAATQTAPSILPDSVPSAPIPAYFRLHPHSPVQIGPRIWLGTIRAGTVAEIKQQAIQHHPSAIVLRIEGVVKDELSRGTEISYPIDDEAELGGYLAHVAGGKVTFVVKLGPGYG